MPVGVDIGNGADGEGEGGNTDGYESEEIEPDEEEFLSDQHENDDTGLVDLTEATNHDFTDAGSAPEAQLEV
jgi:hypothetical protein